MRTVLPSCERADELIQPGVILVLRPQANARIVVEPQPPSWLVQPETFSSSQDLILSTRSLHVLGELRTNLDRISLLLGTPIISRFSIPPPTTG